MLIITILKFSGQKTKLILLSLLKWKRFIDLKMNRNVVSILHFFRSISMNVDSSIFLLQMCNIFGNGYTRGQKADQLFKIECFKIE